MEREELRKELTRLQFLEQRSRELTILDRLRQLRKKNRKQAGPEDPTN